MTKEEWADDARDINRERIAPSSDDTYPAVRQEFVYEWLVAERERLIDRVRYLEVDNANAWKQRDEILKDRNQLLSQLNTGPLSSDEWQIRAIRAERAKEAAEANLNRMSGGTGSE